jgi:predicted O-linked N-acetylglucosamine transferase (SPINDLY family)
MSKDNIQQELHSAFSNHQAGNLTRAAELYRDVLKSDPDNTHALHYLGVIEAGAGNFKSAKSLMARSLSSQPMNVPYLENYATILCQAGDYQSALQACQEGLQLAPRSASLLYVSATSLMKLKRLDGSISQFDKLIAIQPNHAVAINERGSVLALMNKLDAALDAAEKALTLQPQYADAYLNKGNLCSALKRYEEAIVAYDRALALKPDLVEAWFGRGNVLRELKRYDESFVAYDRALALKPDSAKAWLGRANTLATLARYEEAAATYENALALDPDLAEALVGYGNVLRQFDRCEKALAVYNEALSLNPELATAMLGRANALYDLKRYDDAAVSYDSALALDSSLAGAWFGRGNVFNVKRQHGEAADRFAETLKADPQFPFVKGMLLHQKLLCCDWRDVDNLAAQIDEDIASNRLSAEPFGWQGVSQSQRSLQLCAELYNEKNYRPNITPAGWRSFGQNRKIRLGYSSGELREQATSHLIIGVLEMHDRAQFEIYAFDNGWDDQSDTRKRIQDAVPNIVNIRGLDDESAAAAIRESEIDILINLNGYFGEHRTRLFAHRPAPIQVNYLGFPGTLGAPYMDYLIADQHVIPPNDKGFYSEKIVYLPDCYQPNDHCREIGTHVFTRGECGLPEQGFVFCCFNNNYKIMPDLFERWMRILKRVEGSFLWLIEDNVSVPSNLRKEARAKSVNPERIVFAKRIHPSEHLARHRVADLFLDTLPYNAHTTASDSLWAGLPVLTQAGETFPGRVAASLLRTLGLPELIALTPQAYEDLAVELAINAKRLADIRIRLARNRLTSPLFDTKLYTQHLEAAYSTMYMRRRADLPPDHIVITQ